MEDLYNLQELFSNNYRNGNSQQLGTVLLNNLDNIEYLVNFVKKNKLPFILLGAYLLNSGFLPQVLNLFTGFNGNRYDGRGNSDYNPNLLLNMFLEFFNGRLNNSGKFNSFANLLKL